MNMESQDRQALIDAKCRRVARTAEVIIRKCISQTYRLPKSEYYLKAIEECMTLYKQKCYPMGLADERIADYLLFHLYRYRDVVTGRRWSIMWLFTTLNVEKYKEQFLTKEGKSGIRYYIQEWMDENGLRMDRLLTVMAPPKPSILAQMVFMPSEEPIKRRWHNTENGFLLCQRSTTGWSPLSAMCRRCDFKDKCMRETEHKYPELIRYRKKNG